MIQDIKYEKSIGYNLSETCAGVSCFVVFFLVFILFLFFSVSSKVIVIVIQFIFLGINIFWVPLRSHFNPHLMAQAEMSLGLTQNIFMLGNTNLLLHQM